MNGSQLSLFRRNFECLIKEGCVFRQRDPSLVSTVFTHEQLFLKLAIEASLSK